MSADASQIYQVVMNLGTNAAHAMSGGGFLSVSMDRVAVGESDAALSADLQAGDYVRLSVQDTGTGMGGDTLERLFEPFFTTKGVMGTGLGLSVVHGIVKDHGGAITVESEVGKGTTFRVYFPAALPDAVQSQPEASGLIRGSGEHIMYIDDEGMLASAMARVLQLLGYRCTAYSDPVLAIQAFRSDPGAFDAVVTDMTMPEMSGIDVARALRAIRPNVPVAVTSGRWSESTDGFQLAGIATRINKPSSIEELSQALHGLLQGPVGAVRRSG